MQTAQRVTDGAPYLAVQSSCSWVSWVHKRGKNYQRRRMPLALHHCRPVTHARPQSQRATRAWPHGDCVPSPSLLAPPSLATSARMRATASPGGGLDEPSQSVCCAPAQCA